MSKKNADRILSGLNEVLAIAEGRAAPARVIVPEKVDVRSLRAREGLTQHQFAEAFGLSVAAVRDWEQQRRQPDPAARVLLKVIEHNPTAVREALAAG